MNIDEERHQKKHKHMKTIALEWRGKSFLNNVLMYFLECLGQS